MLPLVLFCFIATACLLSGFWLIGGDYPLILVKQGGYWLMLITFLIFIFSLYQERSSYLTNPKQALRSNRWVFLTAGLSVVVLFLLQETYFKITMDEVVLASTSMHMHLEKEVFTVSRGYEVNGVFYILGGYLDKRPYFFAFMVSLVHDIFGYRTSNVFYFNAVVSFLLLVGVFFAAKTFGGRRWGWLAMLLLLSLPLFGFNVNGGGFELFNLLMLLLTAYLGKCWIEKPSQNSLTAFAFSGLLLAQCRYESILFVCPVGLLIVWVWVKEKRVILSWPVYLAPLMLVPYVLQNRVLNESKVLWQLEENQTTVFGLGYLVQNLKSAQAFFFHTGLNQGNSLILLILVAVAVGLGVLYCLHYAAFYPREKTAWRVVAWSFGLTALFNFVLLLFYYWGQIGDPVAARLALPLHFVAVFFVVYILSREPWSEWASKVCLVSTVACIWFFAVPNIAQAKYMRLAYEARQIDWMNDRISELNGSVLIISDYNLMGLSRQIPTVPILHTVDKKPELMFHIQNKTFSEILLVHRDSAPDTTILGFQKLLQLEELESHFDLERLYSYRLGPQDTALISRVTGLKMSGEESATYEAYVTEVREAAGTEDYDPSIYFSKWLP